MDNGKNAFLWGLIQFSFQVLVMQISASLFAKILMWQLKKHIPHFESHLVYPYHDNCLKIYNYIKLFSIFSINVLVVTPDSYHYHHPSLQMISKSSNLLLFLKVLSAPYQHINIITVLSLCNHIKLMTKKISLHLTWSKWWCHEYLKASM